MVLGKYLRLHLENINDIEQLMFVLQEYYCKNNLNKTFLHEFKERKEDHFN